jgi:hypothetical protein
LESQSFLVQTVRITFEFEKWWKVVQMANQKPVSPLLTDLDGASVMISVGSLSFGVATADFDGRTVFERLITSYVPISFNIDIGAEREIDDSHAALLFELIKTAPKRTFNFAFTCNNLVASPFFPGSTVDRRASGATRCGFSIGLQTPNLFLAEDETLKHWETKQEDTWQRIGNLFSGEKDFIGIDTSCAPLTDAQGSVLRVLKQIAQNEVIQYDEKDPLAALLSSDLPLRLTRFLKSIDADALTRHAPAIKVGLNGLMWACVEDVLLVIATCRGSLALIRAR